MTDSTFTDQEAKELTRKLCLAMHNKIEESGIDQTVLGSWAPSAAIIEDEFNNFIEFTLFHFTEDQSVGAMKMALADFQLPLYMPNSESFGKFFEQYGHRVIDEAND